MREFDFVQSETRQQNSRSSILDTNTGNSDVLYKYSLASVKLLNTCSHL